MRAKPRKPIEGQRGKDIPWVPTPRALVETMLDMASVSPDDYVIDLGSGDGRAVIAAAQRGARALGIEYDEVLIEVSRIAAAKAGVAERAEFVRADLYDVDISNASVVVLFLMPENLLQLAPKFLALKPGSRIVTNRFAIEGWDADERVRIGGDSDFCCTAYRYTVGVNACAARAP